jgi:hypothetical protein
MINPNRIPRLNPMAAVAARDGATVNVRESQLAFAVKLFGN